MLSSTSIVASNFENLPQVSGTDSYYFVGALISDIILENGGLDLLKEALNSGKENQDLLEFLEKRVGLNKQKLDNLLKIKFKKISIEQRFVFQINY